MKKTTKFLLVLAAVVAMTIGAVSTVMAADEYRTIDSATWALQDNDTWQAKDTTGAQLQNCWATDSTGKWYYFEGKTILQNAFLKWRGDYYFFDENGYMCTSWVKFTDDALDDVADFEDFVDTDLAIFEDDTAYEKSIWCYFGNDGTAVVDGWAEDCGLWYYFDGMVMVCDDYDYEIDNKIYGFSGDGNMHVGWLPVVQKNDNGKEGPVKGSDTLGSSWVYYNTNGTMVEAGWNKIDDQWFYFAANPAKNARYELLDEGTPIMIHSAYLDINGNYFYFNGDGVMQTGAVKFSKKQKFYTSVEKFLKEKVAETTDKEAYVYFDDKTGAQKFKDKVAGNQWYLDKTVTETIYSVGKGKATKATAVTGGAIGIDTIDYSAADKFTDAKPEVVGDKVFNAFRVDGDNVYYYDANGEMVKSDVVDIKVGEVILTLAFNKDGKLQGLDKEVGDKVRLNGTYYYYSDVDFGAVVFGDNVYMACGTKKPVTD